MWNNQGISDWIGYLSQFVAYAAVGTGTAPPTMSDSALSVPVTQKAIGGIIIVGNLAVIDTLFIDSEANGALTEWGLRDTSLLMIARDLFDSTVNKTADYEMILSIAVTMENKV